MAGSSRHSSAEPTSASRRLSQDSDEDDEVDNEELWHHRRIQQQVGYLSLGASFSGGLSPQPSSSVECERRVSPLDPNLSSAARYSPPPPYNSPMGGIEGSLEHPDSPMEDLSHGSSLPRFPVGVSSSMPSGTPSLVVSETHRATPDDHEPGSRGGSSLGVSNSLFSTQRILGRTQPRWGSPHIVTDEDDEDEEEEEDDDEEEEEEEDNTPAAPIESVWAKQRKLNMGEVARSSALRAGPSGIQGTPQPGHSRIEDVRCADRNEVESVHCAGPSGVEAVHCAGPSGLQDLARPGPSSNLHTAPQPSPSILQAIPQPSPSGDGMVTQTNRCRSPDSDTDSESDSPENLPPFSSSPGPSGIGSQLVRLSDGEAEALVGNVSGCEASSSIRGQASPLGSPRTPADNCIVSSSTGHIDSIPPTPAEFQGNDVSGPSSPVSPSLASVAILDSTVDSTSGRGIMDPQGDSSDDDSDDNLAPSDQMQLPVMADEGAEISTSEIGLQHSDDSQDVGMLVSPQGMFTSGRASANRFIEQFSLSLSHFSTNSLDASLSGDVSDQRTPQNTPPPPPDPGPYLDDPLAIPGPSRLSLPCPEQPVSSQAQAVPTVSQGNDFPSTSSTQMLTHPVEVLDSSLPLLHISSELPVCSSAPDNNQLQDAGRSDGLEPLVTIASSASNSLNSDDLAGSSGNQALSQLNQSYVLELNEDSSLNSDGALSSGSLVGKDDLQNQGVNQADFSNLDSSHHSLVDPSRISASSLSTSLSLTLASSELNGVIDAAMPGPSQQPSLSQHILPSQPDQVSLLVGSGDDSNDGALLMMLSSNSHSLHDPLVLGKQLQREASSLVSQLRPESQALQPCSSDSAANDSLQEASGQRQNEVNSSVSDSDVPSFIGADIWCGDCEQAYSHECPQHRIQAISDKPVRTRAWASLPAQHLVIRKHADTEEYGVYVRKAIPKRTQFGPIEGVLKEDSNGSVSPHGLIYTINQGDQTLHLDTSDEATSNWMRFVRQATTYLEQNCVVMQVDENLVFLTTTDIAPRTELRVGYSKQYGDKRGLHILQPTAEEIKILESLRKSWPCYECDEAFESSAELQQHLVCHDEEVGEEEKKKRKRIKTRRPRNNGEVETGMKRLAKKVKVSGEGTSEAGTSSQADANSRLAMPVVEGIQHSQCATCNLVFTMPELLKIHQHTHEGAQVQEGNDALVKMKLKEKACPQCFKFFEAAEELLAHIGGHGFFLPLQAKPHKCDFCYKSFLRRERLEAHMAVHGNETEKPFRCSLCLRRFCSNTALNTHIKFHIEGSKGYDCPICREGFFSVAGLKSHVSSHCVNGEYACPTCKKVFPTYSKIRRHIRSYHAIMPHTCSICSKEMPSVDKLKIHMLSHSERRDFLCPDCGKRFKRKDKLREHSKRMHSNDREAKTSKAVAKGPPKFVPKVDPADYKQFLYKCHTCLLGFKRRGMLVNHLAKRHPNIDPSTVPELNQPILKAKRCYSCQHCDKMYRSSSKRKLHILKYHPGAELPPPSTNHNENENGEVPAYSKTYPHPCLWCYRQYTTRARLLRHQRHHHPDLCNHKSQMKEYSAEAPEAAVEEDEAQMEAPAGLSGELTLGGQLVTDASILRNHRLVSLTRGESEEAGVEVKEDDLLTQAMGEITPLSGGEQYVRIVGTGAEGQQVVVGTAQGGRPLLVSSDGGQQGATLALVTTDGPETVTLSLPAGQFISLIPGLPVAGTASTVTSTSRTVTSGSSSVNIHTVEGQDGAGTSGDLQGEGVPAAIRMAQGFGQAISGSEAEGVEQVVLETHPPSSPSASVVWPQALTFASTPN
ncbi:uncharacterized protein LOC125044283 [Penaeus chinensis]|uniref:uncharacterized protein LOC125044283 n=1 Tax=Penaeus chinensis TaxID=139456 RepID=UPI001FB667BA|nr:uncharacterized protein LOC125044283 [Penaeus chinensis]